jgi:predicted GNAT family acetyltransferase
MSLVSLHNKTEIEAFVRQNPILHLFELGDLDDFFWPYTVWYALKETSTIRQLALLYLAVTPPVLLAYPDPPQEQMRQLLRSLLPLLPKRVYAHLHPGHLDIVSAAHHVHAHGRHYKMGLRDASQLIGDENVDVVSLTDADLPALERLYHESYPDNAFSARMLQTGWYYGVRQGSAIIAVAGLHVYSPTYRVAALGNVTTHPAVRSRGLARAVCARLCQDLRQQGIEHIGLNVKVDNTPAIALYRSLGFEPMAEFGAYTLEGK